MNIKEYVDTANLYLREEFNTKNIRVGKCYRLAEGYNFSIEGKFPEEGYNEWQSLVISNTLYVSFDKKEIRLIHIKEYFDRMEYFQSEDEIDISNYIN